MLYDPQSVTLAMHIPDNFISPSTGAVFWVIMIPIWVLCFRSVIRNSTPEKMAYLGAGAAFSFLIMMFNVPTPGGTTAHGVGGALIALLLGPQYATVAVSVALLLQALLFGDGGLITLGANCFNMAFVLPFVAYGLYVGLRKILPDGWKERVAEFIAGYIGITLAAFCVALELGVQPLLFRDAAGQALYFPFSFTVTIPAMLIPHLAVAGVVEGLVTVVVVEFVRRTAPEIIEANARVTTSDGPASSAHSGLRTSAWIALGVVALLSPLGLIATGDAWGEWGAEDFMAATGLDYVPQYIAHGFTWNALLPDYSLAGLPDIVGYILSAVIGIAVMTIVFRLLALAVRDRKAVGAKA
ncbi:MULTISPECIES: cobalt transporter CbiM [unclassified Bifidobacterium]|uniref:cobalt transporter CbiM n=1 Tax=unclassified Bifidobacterium TaxID=2608897 RepID=UPI001C61428F|nr:MULTISPECIES: cobalt transporter CbiM [unclassified Bifidobacterium]